MRIWRMALQNRMKVPGSNYLFPATHDPGQGLQGVGHAKISSPSPEVDVILELKHKAFAEY